MRECIGDDSTAELGAESDAASQAPQDPPALDIVALRRSLLLADVDLGTGRSLEVGPLAAALITREMADAY